MLLVQKELGMGIVVLLFSSFCFLISYFLSLAVSIKKKKTHFCLTYCQELVVLLVFFLLLLFCFVLFFLSDGMFLRRGKCLIWMKGTCAQG